MLYTAVTRCRNRLILAETGKSAPWSKFSKAYEKLGLLTAHALPTEPPEHGGKVRTIVGAAPPILSLALLSVSFLSVFSLSFRFLSLSPLSCLFFALCCSPLFSQAETMMPDELVELGLDFVERVDPTGESDPDQAQRDYHNAIKFFKRAGDLAKDMLQRVEAVAKHAAVWDAVKRAPREDWASREHLAVDACADLLQVRKVWK